MMQRTKIAMLVEVTGRYEAAGVTMIITIFMLMMMIPTITT